MKKLILIISSLLLILLSSGCVKSSFLEPEVVQPDESLPPVSRLKAISDITEVALEWKPNYSEFVAGYSVYRAVGNPNGDFIRIAKIKDRYASHYLDRNLEPATTYFYRISLFTKDGRESVPAETIKVTTKPRPQSVPFVKAIGGLANQIKLLWRPHPNPKVVSYIIERKEADSDKWKKIDEIEGRLNAEYIDKDVKENRIYFYRIKVRTADGVISKPSEIVKASTKPLPKTVKNVKATTNLPKKIIITWEKSPEKDIEYYKVYRNLFIKDLLYKEIGRTKENRYVDYIGKDGAVYYYKVTAVDKDGLESLMQDRPAKGSTLPKPSSPKIISASVIGRAANIEWKPTDNRAVSYIVVKKYRIDLLKFKKIKFTHITGTSFVDKNLKPKIKYEYYVIAVDKNGIESKPSKSVFLEVKE